MGGGGPNETEVCYGGSPEMTEAGQPPTAQGSLERTPFVHLLVYLADRQVSGTLVLAEPDQAPGEEHAIYFVEGTAAKFRTGKPIAHLGRVLFELGYLSEQVLNESLSAIAGRGELHGEYLCRTGAIDRQKLLAGLRSQAQRKMAYLFSLPSSTVYAFFQDSNLLDNWGGPELMPLEQLATIWAAVCARGDEPIVDMMLGRLGATTLKLHDRSDVSRFGFSPQELAVIDLIRARPCSLPALMDSGILPRRTIELIVYALLVTRHLDHGADRAAPVGVARSSDLLRPRTSSSTGNVPLARVKLASRAAEVSGSDRPPASSRTSSSPPSSDRTRAPSNAPPAQHISSLPPSNPGALTPDLQARRDSVLLRAENIDRENYFSMLGVAREAPDADIQAAYYALAKAWHPDRLPPELARLRDPAAKVFSRMSEAYETLSDPAKRKRYVDVMKGGGGTPEEANKIQQILDAASDFQRAEILWKKNDPTAEKYVTRAYQADPEQADYIALYAIVQLSKRQTDAPVDDLVKLCDRAIENHERCERAYFCRAMLKKRIGKIESAMSDFRAAYEINPKNLDAAREVRLYEMRRARLSPERRSDPGARRSVPPPVTKSTPAGRSSIPPRKTPEPPAKKEGGVFSGLGKLFKR
jgi:curved DNA-binding protein CbpA